MRKKQLTNRANTNTITAVGDSQTALVAAADYGVAGYSTYSTLLAHMLRKQGCNVKSRTFGVGGDSTSHVLGRASAFNSYDVPKLAIIYCGVNDPFASSTGTAVAGSSTTITLAASANSKFNSYVGSVVTITSGTGSGQSRTITAYTTSKVATVDTAWTTAPNATSVYSIAAPTLAQTQKNLQAIIKVFKHNVKGVFNSTSVTVWNQSQLPAYGKVGDRFVVMNDTSTTGGTKEPSIDILGFNPTIQGDYSLSPRQSVWEWRASRSGESGWGRVADDGADSFTDGCSMIITVSPNYLNYPSGGDNFNVTTNSGSKYAPYVDVRTAAGNAASIEGVTFFDLYAYQSMLIHGGTFLGKTIYSETLQGSSSWHVAPTDQHHNQYGQETVARGLLNTIVVQDGWLSKLSE